MSAQLLIADLPKGVEIQSPSLQATVVINGGLFFLDDVQTNLTNDQINDLHSDYMLGDLQQYNEFTPGYFYEL